MPEPSDPLPSLDTLQRRIESARPQPSVEGANNTSGAEMGRAMRLAVELLAGAAVGGVFGYFIDRWLETSPLFLIVCFFLGVAGGFRNLMRAMQENSNG